MNYVFVVVGVGGTGSLVARDLPKIIMDSGSKMVVIDGDVVEEKNMKRQAYQSHDIGDNKAIALSRKINTFYGDICEAIDGYVTKNEIVELLKSKYKGCPPVLIGCVDNDNTRVLLEQTFQQLPECVYIDSANSEYDGNVYVALKYHTGKTEGKLRSQTYQLKDDVHPTEKNCEEQAAAGNMQYMITNLKMATAVLEHIYLLGQGKVKRGVTVVRRFEEVHTDPEAGA